jgi:hypothetical protein
MTRDHDPGAMPELDAALRPLVSLWSASAHLPAASDILHRARLRDREAAAERLSRWHFRTRTLGIAVFAIAAVWAARETYPWWSGWLDQRLLESPPMPSTADAAVLAGAVLAASAAIVWVALLFAEE